MSIKCILLFCVMALATALLDPCPAPESLRPCGCDFTGINCVKVKNISQLEAAFRGTKKTMHKALWIQGVPVDAINADTFGGVRLRLFGNKLTSVDYKRIAVFQKLRLLNLAQNNIDHIPAFAFKNPSLETLLLNTNPISSIGAGSPPYSFTIPRHNPLLQITLSAGIIESIDEKAFYKVAPLTLRLTMNKLEEFSGPVFKPLMEAMTLNAKRINKLGQAKIETRGNRFTCRGCSFSWLTTLQGRPDLYLMLFDFQCSDRTSVWNVTNSLIGCPRGGQ
ncbi:hypothetical protein MRX96_053010 [Rhipicephalus microplus]